MVTRPELSPSALRIAQVAQNLVQEVGYNGFSFEHIAQEVGMRKASIHHHFASKADLGVAVVQSYTHAFEGALQGILSSAPSAPQRLTAYADLFEATFANQQHLCVCGMLSAEANSLDAAVKAQVQHFFQSNMTWLTYVVQEGMDSGAIQKGNDAAAVAQTCLSMLEGAMLVGRCVSAPMGPRRMMDMFLGVLVT